MPCKNFLAVETELPLELIKKSESNFEETYIINSKIMNYKEIYPKNFFKDFDDWQLKQATELPTRLIDISLTEESCPKNVKINEIKDIIEESAEIKNYAILSYSWGTFLRGKLKKVSHLSLGGEKSFFKAIKACKEAININYLWMDCLCIDQENKEELAQELARVRQYYSNAKVTLISIQGNLITTQKDLLGHLQQGSENMENAFSAASDIIGIIVKSDWFQRSWTFQEGLLSKQTIFMFDDYLIDGRFLAMTWCIKQKPENKFSKLVRKEDIENFLNFYSRKVATPLGWAYYHNGYSLEDTVYLSLCQALKVMKKRRRYIAVDSIYSILGLLPYGHKIKPKYKGVLWGEEQHIYKEEDASKVLNEVMKIAAEEGYGELFSWYGESSNLAEFCWLPKILVDNKNTKKNGSILIEEVLEGVRCELNSVFFIEDGIKIRGSKYDIISKENIIGGNNDKLFSIRLLVKIEGSLSGKLVNLQGTRKTLEKIIIRKSERNDTKLLLLNRKQWKSSSPIALLVNCLGDEICHRIDLVSLLEGSENLTNPNEELIIRMESSSELVNSNMHETNLKKKKEEKHTFETLAYIEYHKN